MPRLRSVLRGLVCYLGGRPLPSTLPLLRDGSLPSRCLVSFFIFLAVLLLFEQPIFGYDLVRHASGPQSVVLVGAASDLVASPRGARVSRAAYLAVLACIGLWHDRRGLVGAASLSSWTLWPVVDLGRFDNDVPLAVHRLCSSRDLQRFLD